MFIQFLWRAFHQLINRDVVIKRSLGAKVKRYDLFIRQILSAIKIYDFGFWKTQNILVITGNQGMLIAIIKHAKFNCLVFICLCFDVISILVVNGEDGVGERAFQIVIVVLRPVVGSLTSFVCQKG